MKTTKPLIIAIDGPSGAGKGTFACALARLSGLPYLDTGLLYRKTAYLAVRAADEDNAARYVADLDLLKDIDENLLRTPQIDRAASIAAAQPSVRKALLDYQRDFARQGKGAILDGRDIGTEIVPDAPVKFFVTASALVRAKRRFLQREGREPDTNEISDMERLIKERDARDSARKSAPLIKARDAYLLETDHLSPAQMIEKGCDYIASRGFENFAI